MSRYDELTIEQLLDITTKHSIKTNKETLRELLNMLDEFSGNVEFGLTIKVLEVRKELLKELFHEI